MIVGVLLAAGASSRMGSPKALVKSRGQSFLVRGVRALWASCDTVITVLGADGERVCEIVGEEFERLVEQGLLAPDLKGAKGRTGDLEVRFAFNDRWAQGMYSSARVGLAAALRAKPKAILLMPVDHPEVRPETVKLLGEVIDEALGAFGGGKKGGAFAYALVPRFKGHRGHPVALSAGLAAAIVADRTARDLSDAIRRHARLVGYLDVADKGVLANLNTPAQAKAATRKPAKASKPTRPRKPAKASKAKRPARKAR